MANKESPLGIIMGRFDHLAPVALRTAETELPFGGLIGNQNQLPVSPLFAADYSISPSEQPKGLRSVGTVPNGATFEDTGFYYVPVGQTPKLTTSDSVAETLFNTPHQMAITPRPIYSLPRSAKKARANHNYISNTIEFANDHRRLAAVGMIAVLAAGTAYQLNGGINGESAQANITGSAKLLPDIRGDNIMRSSAAETIVLNSSANIAIPITLVNGQKAKIALPSTKSMPKEVLNTDVSVYMSGTTDKSGNSIIFATSKGKKYLVDRHAIDLEASFAKQGCPASQVAKKVCIDAFTGNVQISPSPNVSAVEAARINSLLQPKGKDFAKYQAIALHKLELASLIGIEKNSGPDVQRFGDFALRNILKQQAARGGIKLSDKDITFTNNYNLMSHTFSADNVADINSGILTMENVSITSTVNQATTKG